MTSVLPSVGVIGFGDIGIAVCRCDGFSDTGNSVCRCDGFW